ncbi:MAG: hypothetical protein L0G16_02335 [Weeksellaceae bacterium]|nr:hypothetical protein [Weeksellaceae bacterium]
MMLTKEQGQAVTAYLISKKLPMDLLLEVKDHFIEQIENTENTDFETAFGAAKLSWEKELRMVYKFNLPLRKVTVFQRNTDRKISFANLKRTILYFVPFFLLSVFLCYFRKDWAQNLFLFSYIVIGLVTLLSFVLFYKYYKSSTTNDKRNISIYQKGTLIYFLSGMYVVVFNLINFYDRFEKFNISLLMLTNGHLGKVSYIPLIYTYIFMFFWMYGLLYFLQYRKAVTELEQRINLKL